MSNIIRASARIGLLAAGMLLITLFARFPTRAHTTEAADVNWAQFAKFTASDGAAGDWLGFSVAISGNVAVVGAPYDDQNGIDSGSVYLYEKNGSWFDMVETAKLAPAKGRAFDRFGNSVAIDGDTVVVGAPYNDDNGSDSGTVYVFEKPPGGWADMMETANLTPTDPAGGDWFGFAVATSDDAIIAGAPHLGILDDGDAGAAYVFVKPAGGWTDQNEVARITPSDGEAWDGFGYSTAISGDMAAVGAPLDDDNGASSGSAYIFTNPDGEWSNIIETAKLTSSDGAAYDWFGRSISGSGDSIIAGAPQNDAKGASAGSAYIFAKPADGWTDMTETALLTASDGKQGSYFGWSVTIDGNLAAASALSGESSNEAVGVYVFEQPDDGWISGSETVKLSPSKAASLERFGISLAGSGRTFLVGSDSDDDNGSDSGAAYLFAQLGTIEIIKETEPLGGAGFKFGHNIPGGERGFVLDDGQNTTFLQVPCGSYIVIEEDPSPAYDLGLLECTDSAEDGVDSIGDSETRTATINLDPGELVSCRFTNRARGKILVDKVTVPPGHFQSFAFTLSEGKDGMIDEFSVSAQDTAYDSGYIKPGLYHLRENPPANWTLESAVCDNFRAPVLLVLSAGETVRCTFTNSLHKFDILIPFTINSP